VNEDTLAIVDEDTRITIGKVHRLIEHLSYANVLVTEDTVISTVNQERLVGLEHIIHHLSNREIIIAKDCILIGLNEN
jgi:hypothetical protein